MNAREGKIRPAVADALEDELAEKTDDLELTKVCPLCGAHRPSDRSNTKRASDCRACGHIEVTHLGGRCAAPKVVGHPERGLCGCRALAIGVT